MAASKQATSYVVWVWIDHPQDDGGLHDDATDCRSVSLNANKFGLSVRWRKCFIRRKPLSLFVVTILYYTFAVLWYLYVMFSLVVLLL